MKKLLLLSLLFWNATVHAQSFLPTYAPKMHKLSAYGLADDCTLNLNSPTIGADQTNLLDSVLSLANGRDRFFVYWDCAVAISDTVPIKSNTTIIAKAGKGAVARDTMNKPMFKNASPVFSGTPLDENIIIDGGIWHGNNTGQTQVANGTYGGVNVFNFFGVKKLVVQNFTIRRQKCYSVHGINIQDGVYRNFVVDGGADFNGGGALNTDGVHFDGNSNNCIVRNGTIRSIDDAVGINLNDQWRNPLAAAYPFYPADASGPGSNIIVEDIKLNRGLFGVRLLSSTSRADNIIIRRITGYTSAYAVLIDNYWQNPSVITEPGTGDVGTVTVEDIDVFVSPTGTGFYHEAVVSVTCNIENLIMNRISDSRTLVPKIYLAPSGYTFGTVTLDGEPYP